MTYKFLFFLIMLILLFEINKVNTYEPFISNSSNSNILSNHETSHPDDKIVKDGEEILLMTQLNGKRTYEFTQIRAPLGKNILVIVKKGSGVDAEQLSNFPPVKITSSNIKVLNLLGFNNFLMNSLSGTVKYYIKFLSSRDFLEKKNLYDKHIDIQTKFNNCLKENSIISNVNAISKCKTILS